MSLEMVSELLDLVIAYAEKKGLGVTVHELILCEYGNSVIYGECTDGSCGCFDSVLSSLAYEDKVLGEKTIVIIDPIRNRAIFIHK